MSAAAMRERLEDRIKNTAFEIIGKGKQTWRSNALSLQEKDRREFISTIEFCHIDLGNGESKVVLRIDTPFTEHAEGILAALRLAARYEKSLAATTEGAEHDITELIDKQILPALFRRA